MQSSSSGEHRKPRNSRPDGEGRSGGRPRNRNRQGGRPRREGQSRDGEEFRPSEHVRTPRGGKRQEAPKPTAFEKFIKAITFGLIDPAAKRARSTRRPSSERGSSDRPASERGAQRSSTPKTARASGGGEGTESGRRSERRTPTYVEPTTPRLYVGNLSYAVVSADLETLFAAFGSVVEAAVVTRSGTEQSKGFAFVEMASVEEAKAAAAALNDHELEGRKMLVTGAKSEGREDSSGERSERSERPSRSGGGERRERGRGRGRVRNDYEEDPDRVARQVKPLVIETVSTPALAVSNLNAEATDTDIVDLFAGIGTIVRREESGPGKDDRTKNHRIDLAATEEAQKAVELLNGKCFMGHEIQVKEAKAD